MASNFKYATIPNLLKYFNRASDFSSKVQIFPTLTSGNLHLFRDSGYATVLFVNGEELAAAQGTSGAVDSNGEWFYNQETNQIEYYNSNYTSTTINEQIFETGVDNYNFLGQTLVDASLELHNYLDAKFSTPIQKSKQVDIDTTPVTVSEEYDPIIIKSTCYIAAANLIRAKEGQSEEADYYHSLVTNAEGTGLIDRLNQGIYKLSNELDANDKKGKILHRDVSGTMDLVELEGQYFGETYDLIKVLCTTGGAYGTAEFTVSYYSENKLEGKTSTTKIISGTIQDIHSGLRGRWQGSSADADDVWYIEVYGSHMQQTNKSNASIEMRR